MTSPSRPHSSTVLRVGQNALLIECHTLANTLRVFEALRSACDAGELDLNELVPAAQTVLVQGRSARDPAAFSQRLNSMLQDQAAAHDSPARGSATSIPVVYRGTDLAEVARLTSLSEAEVVARHTNATYRVAFTGFAPGFAYLAGGDPLLTVPRHNTPRTRVPGGSVGLAGEFSGIYPRESPGGWQLIGHTDAALWDPARERPALLAPGDAVRFTAQRERVKVPEGRPALRPPTPTAPPAADSVTRPHAPTLTIVNPGLQTIVQDAGRPGYASLGVSRSGAADSAAFHLANRLAGNVRGAAALEISLGVFSADIHESTVLAFTGAMRAAKIMGPGGERRHYPGTAFRVYPGERIELEHPSHGVRTMLAIRGGVLVNPVLGSSAHDSLSLLGPAPLQATDTVYSGAGSRPVVAAPEPLTAHLPAAGEVVVLDVTLGPRDDWFSPASLRALSSTEWEVTPQSNRVGVRLAGPALARSTSHEGLELPSEGLVQGAIQVPPSGQPVIFLADHPVTGGYPVIGVVAQSSMSLAAQLPPGARVRFRVRESES